MRLRSLLRGTAVAALGLALVLPTATQPARAEADYDDWAKWVDVLKDAFDKGKDGRYDPAEITDMMTKLIEAINGVQTDLVGAINSKVDASIRADLRTGVTMIPSLNVAFLRSTAIYSIHRGAYLAAEQVNASHSDAARDAIGRSMVTLFTALNDAYIQVDAEERAKGKESNLAAFHRPNFRKALEDLIPKIEPRCHETVNGHLGEVLAYTCTFGDKTVKAEYDLATRTTWINGSQRIVGPITGDVMRIVDAQMLNETVRPIAQAALDELIAEGVGLPQN